MGFSCSGCFGRVDVLDEADDAAGELEVVRLGGALVGDDDVQPGVEERQLTQPRRQRVEVVLLHLEDDGIRVERHLGARLVGDADLLYRTLGHAAHVLLLVHFSVALDLDMQPIGQRVDTADANPVQTARDLVGAVFELPASVKLRHHHVEGVHARHRRVRPHRDTATVVHHGDGVVGVNEHLDHGRVARQRLVDRVVHHLEDQVVQPPNVGVTDVHARALAHRFEPLQHGDAGSVVLGP